MGVIVCDKKMYHSYKEGMKEAVGMSKKYKQKYRIYKCNECGLFHLSTIHKSTLNQARNTKYPMKVTSIHYEIKQKQVRRIPKKLKQIAGNIATSKLISSEMAEKLKLLFTN
jgi:hypothetical protein